MAQELDKQPLVIRPRSVVRTRPRVQALVLGGNRVEKLELTLAGKDRIVPLHVVEDGCDDRMRRGKCSENWVLCGGNRRSSSRV